MDENDVKSLLNRILISAKVKYKKSYHVCALVQSMSGQFKSPTITVGSLCENTECAMSVSLCLRARGAVLLDGCL